MDSTTLLTGYFITLTPVHLWCIHVIRTCQNPSYSCPYMAMWLETHGPVTLHRARNHHRGLWQPCGLVTTQILLHQYLHKHVHVHVRLYRGTRTLTRACGCPCAFLVAVSATLCEAKGVCPCMFAEKNKNCKSTTENSIKHVKYTRHTPIV